MYNVQGTPLHHGKSYFCLMLSRNTGITNVCVCSTRDEMTSLVKIHLREWEQHLQYSGKRATWWIFITRLVGKLVNSTAYLAEPVGGASRWRNL